MPTPVKLCAISMNSMLYNGRDKEASWKEASGLIDSTAHYKPDLFLLPEWFLVGDMHDRISDPEYIECAGSPMLKRIAAKAAERHAYIAANVLYRDDIGVRNTTVLFDRQGRAVHLYHKTFPTDTELDHNVVPGPLNPTCYDSEFGRIGFCICFDAQFDQLFAHYRKSRIKLLLFSSYFPAGFILQQLAYRGHHYVMSSHSQGYESVIVDDFGRVVAKADMFNLAMCWQLNLDSEVLSLSDNTEAIPEIRRRFGDKVLVEVFREEDMLRLVNNVPDRTVVDVIKECGLIRLEAFLGNAIARADAARPAAVAVK